MPQKKNPDAAELIRAKSGRVNGALISLLTIMKGLPLSYAKDMQEDKEAVFDVYDTLLMVIKITKELIAAIEPKKSKMESEAENGFSTSTDLADWLVKKFGMPFREAHQITGRIVKDASNKNKKLSEMSMLDLKAIDQRITKEVFSILSVENSIESRNSYGGTSSAQVKKQIRFWKRKLNA
jgi:argininosuccinate lyase